MGVEVGTGVAIPGRPAPTPSVINGSGPRIVGPSVVGGTIVIGGGEAIVRIAAVVVAAVPIRVALSAHIVGSLDVGPAAMGIEGPLARAPAFAHAPNPPS